MAVNTRLSYDAGGITCLSLSEEWHCDEINMRAFYGKCSGFNYNNEFG